MRKKKKRKTLKMNLHLVKMLEVMNLLLQTLALLLFLVILKMKKQKKMNQLMKAMKTTVFHTSCFKNQVIGYRGSVTFHCFQFNFQLGLICITKSY